MMSSSILLTRVALVATILCGELAHADSVNSPNVTMGVDRNRSVGSGAGNAPVTVNTVTIAETQLAEYASGPGKVISLTLRPGFAFDPASPVSARSATIGLNGQAPNQPATIVPVPGTTTLAFALTSGTDAAVQDIVRIDGIRLLIAGPEGAVGPAQTTLGLTTSTAGGAFTDQGIVAASLVTGVADHLVFSTQPGDTQAGAPLLPVVRVVDFGGNVVPDDDRNVLFRLEQNPGATTLRGVDTIPVANGVAASLEADLLRVDVAADGYTLRASHDGDPLQTSDTTESEPFAVTAGPPGRLAITTQPSDGIAGEPLRVQVTVLDAFDNVAADGRVAVTLDLGEGPAGARLLGALTQESVGGVATWDVAEALHLAVAGSGYTLVASGVGDPVTSVPFAIVAGPARRLRFVEDPDGVTEREPIATPPAIEVLDDFGNRTPSAAEVTLAVSSCAGALVAAPTAAENGLATFADVVIDASCTGAVLEASSPGLVGARSAPFDVSPGADARPISVGAFVARPGKHVKLVARGVFVLPQRDGVDDPTLGGGSLTVTGARGAVTIALPAEGWRALGTDGAKGFRFASATCPVVAVKQRVVKALCNGDTGTLALPESGPVEIVLRTGSGTARYCGVCGGTVKGDPTRVLKRAACLAPPACR